MNKTYYTPDGIRLVFPDKSLQDLFVSFKLTDTKRKHFKINYPNHPHVEVSSFCTIHGDGITEYLSAEVFPTEELYDWLHSNMLSIVGGLYWELVVRDDHSVLILVKYNCIIGSRWLTIVEAETIPELKPFLKEKVV